MPKIQLHTQMKRLPVQVPSVFIETYMPPANGEFVKVYLYLLRLVQLPGEEVSLSLLADALSCTEKDVIRALKYWEQRKLLALTFGEDGSLSGVTLAEPEEEAPGASAPKTGQEKAPEYAQGTVQPQEKPQPSEAPAVKQKPEAEKRTAAQAAPRVPRLSRDQLAKLKQDEEFAQLLFLAETYLGKTLSPTEINSLCYYYDTLKFPVDLIEYLVETCVSRGHKSFRYIETVAQSWHQAGVRTVEDARKQSSQYTQQYYSVLRAFGVTDRAPIEREIQMIDHWMKDYGFTTDMICEACSRTIQSINKVSFSYADSILKNWQLQKVYSLKELELSDARHQSKAKPRPESTGRKPQTNNRFNNFNQRNYDYQQLEQQLLTKQ